MATIAASDDPSPARGGAGRASPAGVASKRSMRPRRRLVGILLMNITGFGLPDA